MFPSLGSDLVCLTALLGRESVYGQPSACTLEGFTSLFYPPPARGMHSHPSSLHVGPFFAIFRYSFCVIAGAILRSVFYDTYFLVFITETVNHAYHSFTPIAFETTGVCGPCSVCFVTDLRHF